MDIDRVADSQPKTQENVVQRTVTLRHPIRSRARRLMQKPPRLNVGRKPRAKKPRSQDSSKKPIVRQTSKSRKSNGDCKTLKSRKNRVERKNPNLRRRSKAQKPKRPLPTACTSKGRKRAAVRKTKRSCLDAEVKHYETEQPEQ